MLTPTKRKIIKEVDEGTEIFLVRHGERMDLTESGSAWRATVPKSRRFDPPLTENGKLQAQEAGRMLNSIEGIQFEHIFSSPLARTLSTASEIAQVLRLPVTVVPGLASCAAAVAKVGINHVDLLSSEAMKALCASIVDIDYRAPRNFTAAINYITTLYQPALVVTHREGIRELYGGRIALPYCTIARFRTTRHKWQLIHMSGPCERAESHQEDKRKVEHDDQSAPESSATSASIHSTKKNHSDSSAFNLLPEISSSSLVFPSQ